MTRRRATAAGLLLAGLALAAPAGGAEEGPADRLLRAGAAAYHRGALEEAAGAWTEAARLYGGDRPGEQAGALTRLARALELLGRRGDAAQALHRAREAATAAGDRAALVHVLAALGSLTLADGHPQRARPYLDGALAEAREPGELAVVLNEVGRVAAAEHRTDDALAAFRRSAELARGAGHAALAARAATSAAQVAVPGGRARAAVDLLDAARADLERLPPSRDLAYGLVGLGLGYRDARPGLPDRADALWLAAAEALRQAGTTAESIGDPRAISYAWGHLGTLYEVEGRPAEALQLTRRAIVAAQRTSAPESLYRWQWQSGRLLRTLGRLDEAIAAYRRAVGTLESIRGDLAADAEAPRLSFRQSVGPVYLELVDLLLQRAAAAGDGAAAQPDLVEARESVELLKVAELRDYFRDDCVDAARARIRALDVVSRTAVIIYPILLADRTELLVSLPGGLRRVGVPVGLAELTREVRRFRHTLEKRTTREFLVPARRLYDWLIRPVEPALAGLSVDTLVFVPDGPLRTVPMAALHDGRQFLVARYALATTPSLNLTDPRPLPRESTRVLAVGVTEAIQGFPPLPHVSGELAAIRQVFGTTTLLNEEFRVAALEHSLREERFSVLHIASHGQFEADVGNTFLLAFDGRLTMDRLDQMVGLFRTRDEPLELLILSACETAAGDDRAALGLAGVAVRAGARSALATLWYINDEASAELIGEFYRQLQTPSISRAVALQRAQLRLLADRRYGHPALWSPFLLINNWL